MMWVVASRRSFHGRPGAQHGAIDVHREPREPSRDEQPNQAPDEGADPVVPCATPLSQRPAHPFVQTHEPAA